MGIIAAALMLLLSQLTMSGMSSYVYPNYYGSAAAQSLASLVGMAGTLLICAPPPSSSPRSSVKGAGYRRCHCGRSCLPAVLPPASF